MAAVVESTRGRVYLPQNAFQPVEVDRPKDLRGIDSPIAKDKRALWCLLYGLDSFDNLFTSRQLVALTTFSDLVQEAHERVVAEAQTACFPADDSLLSTAAQGQKRMLMLWRRTWRLPLARRRVGTALWLSGNLGRGLDA